MNISTKRNRAQLAVNARAFQCFYCLSQVLMFHVTVCIVCVEYLHYAAVYHSSTHIGRAAESYDFQIAYRGYFSIQDWKRQHCHSLVATSPVVLRWLCDSPRTGWAWRTTPYIYVARTSNNRVIVACDLYCCLLPQCEALRICRSGFPIATVYRLMSVIEIVSLFCNWSRLCKSKKGSTYFKTQSVFLLNSTKAV